MLISSIVKMLVVSLLVSVAASAAAAPLSSPKHHQQQQEALHDDEDDDGEWEYLAANHMKTALLVLEGVLAGAVDVELPTLKTCANDVLEDIGQYIMANVASLKLATDEEAAMESVHAIGLSFVSLADVVQDCGLAVKEVEKLEKIGANFADPMTFAYHFGKDIIVNGVSIYDAVEDAFDNYHDEKWYGMGYDVGKAVALAVLGSDLPLSVEIERN
jgi:hypothetical protein